LQNIIYHSRRQSIFHGEHAFGDDVIVIGCNTLSEQHGAADKEYDGY
jgi:hypothetical protein